MYDYMKALQERFDKKPPERLVRAVQSAREEVREGMDDEKRKKLLRLLDAQNILLEEATLMSFTAGFKCKCPAWWRADCGRGCPPPLRHPCRPRSSDWRRCAGGNGRSVPAAGRSS